MDREKRFAIIDQFHESFAWITVTGFGCMVYLASIYSGTERRVLMLQLLIAIGIMFSDLLLWKKFAREYSTYRRLEHNEPLNENVIPVMNIGRRYDDYLAENCEERRFSISSVGILSYVSLRAISDLSSGIVSIWIARIVSAVAIIMVVSLILMIVVLRLRRLYNSKVKYRT